MSAPSAQPAYPFRCGVGAVFSCLSVLHQPIHQGEPLTISRHLVILYSSTPLPVFHSTIEAVNDSRKSQPPHQQAETRLSRTNRCSFLAPLGNLALWLVAQILLRNKQTRFLHYRY